ncbi:MAG: cytochrome bc complex cytochrome b subunit [Gemmatimonadetes bacterium]|nr:cytochrome bc complex cytochrome b subunit [Gemmatimonadota bacterium]
MSSSAPNDAGAVPSAGTIAAHDGVVPDSSSAHAAVPEHSIAGRLGVRALDYAIPPSANRLPYMLGGLTFVGLLALIGTGVLLDQFFNPEPLSAYDSVVYIMTRVPLGNWVRSIHYWAATVVFVTLFFHILYVFWRRSYTRPREVTWWLGVGLFITVFGLMFTGTTLKGDQEAVEALAHAVAGAKMSPGGAVLTPDFTSSTTLLSRLHSLHVSVLPLVLLALVLGHFALIRVHGIHSHEAKTARFTQHVRRLTAFGLFLCAGLGILAAVFPAVLGHPGVEGVEVTKPAWPFLWIYAVENTVGMTGMLIAPIVLFGFLAAVPLLDRGHDQGAGRPRWVMGLGMLVLLAYIAGIVYGVFAPQMQHLGM